jgi:NAD-dependent deacetylase
MKIFILTGAGVSAESGIQTFRTRNGLWNNYSIQDVSSIQGYQKDPKVVLDFYNDRRMEMNNAAPNNAHKIIADICNNDEYDVTLVTQNIDNLHEKAGADNVIHMHGNINEILCENCGEVYFSKESIYLDTKCSFCKNIGVRPNIVWFGEMPYHLKLIEQSLNEADLFVSIGTSGKVMPASKFARKAKKKRAYTVSINLEKSYSWDFIEEIQGTATRSMTIFQEKLENGYFREKSQERQNRKSK